MNNTITTLTRALPTMLHKFFFQIRNGHGLSKNLRVIRLRRTGYMATIRILKIVVYKAL